MTKRNFKVFTILVFFLTALCIGALVFLPKDFFSPQARETGQTRVVIPQAGNSGGGPNELRENQNLEESTAARVAFSEKESIISILSRDFDDDGLEEQIIAYRNLQEIDTPIFITYVDHDIILDKDVRIWTAPTAATRPGTMVLYSEDLLGDGGICVLISGMNGAGEQTLTVFRKNGLSVFGGDPQFSRDGPFSKIAEFIIEGSIVVQETERSQNFQQGARSQSLSIATYGRDYESSNLLDQIEITYTYNRVNGLYEQSRVVKVPGSQMEQRRVRELLSGDPGHFEEFIDGLWILISPDQSHQQYVYFNTAGREVIFHNNDTEEVYTWQDSSSTRYGLHIIGRNTSLAKIRRTMNIELESLETIRFRVFQDIYLRTGPGVVWDGSYKKVRSLETAAGKKRVQPYLEGVYKCLDGQITLNRDGSYEMYTDALAPPRLAAHDDSIQRGKYVFFTMGEDELLEFRPADPQRYSRETFKVARTLDSETSPRSITLNRVRIGTKGIQDLHEASVLLEKNS